MFATKLVKSMLCAGLLLATFCSIGLVGHAAGLRTRTLSEAIVLGGGLSDTQLAVAVTTGDFNRDGYPDVAVVTRFIGYVFIFLNTQDGGFADPLLFPVGDGPVAIASADFNNDEIRDLAVANADSNNVSILLGIGDGTFQPARNVAVGSVPTGIVVEDFNEDNGEDFAVVNSGSNNVSVVLGNGNGTFRTPVNYAVGNNPVALVVEDFFDHEVKDLAVANAGDGTVSALMGEETLLGPTGTFRPAVTSSAMPGVSVIVADDFRRADLEDLVVASPGSTTVMVLYNNGNHTGTFRPGQNLTVGDTPVAIEAESLRGNLIQDIIVASVGSGTISVFLNNGVGQFSAPATYNVPGASAVGSRDFLNRGVPDVVVVTTDLYPTILFGAGDGTLFIP
jgi:hypothetical protein